MNMNSIFTIVSIILAILALVLLYRVFKGPNVIDRVLAADSMDIYEDESENAIYIHWIDATTEDTKEASEIIKGRFEYFVRRLFN